MKKYIFFSVIFTAALFTLTFPNSALAAQEFVPSSPVCEMNFQGTDADSWCTGTDRNKCDAQEYSFCVGNVRYSFGCKPEGYFPFTRCNCDRDDAGYTVCQYGCEDGACVAGTPPPGGNGNGNGNGDGGGWVTIENPLNATSVEAIIGAISRFIFWVGMALAPVMLIIAGFFFVTAAGDPKRVETGKLIIRYTLIGLAIILLAKGLIAVLQSILGVTGS